MFPTNTANVVTGKVVWSPGKSIWWATMAAITVIGGILTFTWSAFILFLTLTLTVLLFGHSLGSHRKLIHDSFSCSRWLEYALVYTGVQVGLSGPIGLVAQHDLRDYAQRQPDCHDYLRHGKAFWTDGWWQLHCELRLDDPPSLPIPARIIDDEFYRFLERTWILQQIPPAVLLYALGGWAFVIWGVCARITACVTGHWLIGYFAHNHGPMHHIVDGAAVQGHNVRFASILTMGESWHNNHHAFPGSARLGLFAGEWDPGWWILMVLRRMRLAWGFKLPTDCPARPALRALATAQELPELHAATPSATGWLTALSVSCRILGQRRPVHLHGPCVMLSARGVRLIAGSHVILTRTPLHARLRLTDGEQIVFGLPALMIAIGSRNYIAALFAITALPLAIAHESLRRALEV